MTNKILISIIFLLAQLSVYPRTKNTKQNIHAINKHVLELEQRIRKLEQRITLLENTSEKEQMQ